VSGVLAYKIDPTNYENLVWYLEYMEVPKEFTIKELRKLKVQAWYFLVREGILYQKNNQDPDSPLRVLKKEQTKI
ncbi:42261_t:CDS:1, partial [Gigaspora margarita]